MNARRDYDSTVARMAGNIAAGMTGRLRNGNEEEIKADINDIIMVSVDIAVGIVDEVRRREKAPFATSVDKNH